MIAHTLVGTMHRPWQRLYDWLRGTEKLACCVCGRNVRGVRAPARLVFASPPRRGLAVRFRSPGDAARRPLSMSALRRQRPRPPLRLYLDEILASWQRAVTIVQFAPAKTLTDYIRRTMAARRLGDSYRTADLYAEGVRRPRRHRGFVVLRFRFRRSVPLLPRVGARGRRPPGNARSCAVSCGRADAACSWCPSCWASRRSTKTRR